MTQIATLNQQASEVDDDLDQRSDPAGDRMTEYDGEDHDSKIVLTEDSDEIWHVG